MGGERETMSGTKRKDVVLRKKLATNKLRHSVSYWGPTVYSQKKLRHAAASFKPSLRQLLKHPAPISEMKIAMKPWVQEVTSGLHHQDCTQRPRPKLLPLFRRGYPSLTYRWPPHTSRAIHKNVGKQCAVKKRVCCFFLGDLWVMSGEKNGGLFQQRHKRVPPKWPRWSSIHSTKTKKNESIFMRMYVLAQMKMLICWKRNSLPFENPSRGFSFQFT